MKWTDIFQTGLEIKQSVLAKAEGMPSGNAIFEKLFLVRYVHYIFFKSIRKKYFIFRTVDNEEPL